MNGQLKKSCYKPVTDYLLDNELTLKDVLYLRQPIDGKWQELTWQMVMHQARQVAQLLEDLGLERGDRVAIFSKNCAQWFIVDFGISLAGLVSVPLFPNQHSSTTEYILNHAKVKLVFIGKLDNHHWARSTIPNHYKTVSLGYHSDLTVDVLWSSVLETRPRFDIITPKPDELYTIIYSSGTFGLPKGSVYTHQIISNYLALSLNDIYRLGKHEHYHLVSYLSLAHVYERAAIELTSLNGVSDISFIESYVTFYQNLADIKPTFFTAVPRVWRKFQWGIEQKLSEKTLDFVLKIPFLSGLVKKKVRQQLGLDKCYHSFSGASHLPSTVINFFAKFDIYIQEGYGQTENLAYATLALLENNSAYSVGIARLGVELKLDKTGELLIKSPCLMKEYYLEPDATMKILDTDGWLHTGDRATMDEKGYVHLIGRLSDRFKNNQDKIIAPDLIENLFATETIIEYLCLLGQGTRNVLVITLNDVGHAEKKLIIEQQLQTKLIKVNTHLKPHEHVNYIIIAKDTWNSETGLLTPTFKVKRRMIELNYQHLIKEVINQTQPIVWQ